MTQTEPATPRVPPPPGCSHPGLLGHAQPPERGRREVGIPDLSEDSHGLAQCFDRLFVVSQGRGHASCGAQGWARATDVCWCIKSARSAQARRFGQVAAEPPESGERAGQPLGDFCLATLYGPGQHHECCRAPLPGGEPPAVHRSPNLAVRLLREGQTPSGHPPQRRVLIPTSRNCSSRTRGSSPA